MKKTYLQPSVAMDKMELQAILAISGVTSNKDIGYGGIDQDGSVAPESRSMGNWGLWDDGEDE